MFKNYLYNLVLKHENGHQSAQRTLLNPAQAVAADEGLVWLQKEPKVVGKPQGFHDEEDGSPI